MTTLTTIISNANFIACATCMADKGGVNQKAANLGIFAMLGVLVLIFTCLGVTAFNFARKARRSVAQATAAKA
jgi:heme/copper-type cytochrome/quinol oxidase subunit 2